MIELWMWLSGEGMKTKQSLDEKERKSTCLTQEHSVHERIF